MKLPFTIDLCGRVAVVTGGGGVLCSQMARALATCGAKVAVLSLHLESAEKTAQAIREEGGSALALAADALDPSALEAARQQVLAELGKPFLLLNGAGGNRPQGNTDDEFYAGPDLVKQDFFSLDPTAIRQVFDLNVQGALIATQVFAKEMTDIPGASVINISSMGALRPLTKVPAYSAAKAALSNLTQWMATYFAPKGLRVNAISPGFFVTNQNRALLFDTQGNPTPRTEKILRATPMGRFGDPGELIGALLWLASPEASGFVTGTVVAVDGGFSAYAGV